ncbi:D-aminoacyl-tRNA deacylase [Oxalobacter vibrioformis]|uniref:D-aminoacyl-tRNA deacylase n=1 Tax=Oxalobacter vibrioformis TaxID=933080 RepID=A0A9E9P3D8_9BURK|nr:D-aminoacyl-tRNA deacylase [Oxalobacter vibrioformis]WAW10902.1 D-aminoacyl-tRNA deacylase [Oxalobacter vibrioformis]
MIALLQRVSRAQVVVEEEIVGRIGKGLLVLLCAERGDTEKEADALLNRLVNYRVFNDSDGKMNLSLDTVKGDLLLVPQFTLAANTRSGTRPSFSAAASPDVGQRLFDYFTRQAKATVSHVQTGRFGAHMEVELVNDGPVTIWLHTPPADTPA